MSTITFHPNGAVRGIMIAPHDQKVLPARSPQVHQAVHLHPGRDRDRGRRAAPKVQSAKCKVGILRASLHPATCPSRGGGSSRRPFIFNVRTSIGNRALPAAHSLFLIALAHSPGRRRWPPAARRCRVAAPPTASALRASLQHTGADGRRAAALAGRASGRMRSPSPGAFYVP